MGIRSDELLNRIEKAPSGILVFTGAYEVIFINDTFRKLAEHYNLKYPENQLKDDLMDLDILKEELSYLPLGYSFEKEVKSISTPGVGRISLLLKGIPFFEGETFAGGIISAEDFRLSSGEEILSDTLHLQEVVKSSGDFLFISDKAGAIRFSSGRRYSPDISYQNIEDVIPKHNKKEFNKNFKETGKSRYSQRFITQLVFDQNEYECRIDPLLNPEGKPDYYLFTFNEVGRYVLENINLKESLQSSEKFRLTAENADEMIYIYDKDLLLNYSNRKAEQLPDIVQFFNRKRIIEELENSLRFTSELEVEGRYYRVIFIHNSEQVISCFCREITAEKEELQRIKESEELLKNIISGSDIILLNISAQGQILYSNKYFRDHFDAPPNFKTIIEESFRDDFTIPKTKKDFANLPLLSFGRKVTYACSFNPVLSAAGESEYITVTGYDLTREIESRQDLSLYKNVFDSAGDGIAIIMNGRIHLANQTFAELFGYPDEADLTGKRINEISFTEKRDKILDQIRDLETVGYSSERFEFSGRKMDGSQFFVSASLAPFNVGNTIYTIMICRDVTEKRRVQKAIRDSEEKFRNLTENIDDFLFTFERTGSVQRPVFYTASIQKITGYSQDEFLADSRLIFKLIHPDDLQQVKRKLRTLFRSRLQSSEELEFRIINRNGNVVWVRNKINLIRDQFGILQKIYGLVSDITLRKRAEDELKRSTENLMKVNEAKDRFISIISHDLRSPFSSILGFTDLLLNDDELTEEEKKQYARYIQESAKSTLALVNSMLDWTRLQTGRIRFEPEKFTAVNAAEEALQVLAGSAIQKKIKLINDVNREYVIFADRGLLLQVFNNLISNAIKFTKEKGEVIVSAKPSEKLRFLEFSVRDTGIGIQKENLKNLFRVETKFTSEGTAGEKGTGLGLSLVKEIIEKHGGEIWVESEYQKGSNFKFTIPVTPSNILLIDDSNTDRLLYSKLLKNFAPDYSIETAASGREAIEIIRSSPPALIITDHLMPEMNGYDLVLKLKKITISEVPPVIVLSSALDRNIISAYRDAGIEYIFQKPVNLVEFKQAVEKLLRKGYLQQ